jgi:hypothetical protein
MGKVGPPPGFYTRETYDRVLAAYRTAPGNHSRAAAFALVDRRACKRLWEAGWPRLPWARPISVVLQEEGDAARARAREESRRQRETEDAEREKARRAHIEAVEEESRIMAAVRKDLHAAALITAKLMPAMDALVGVVRSAVFDAQGQVLATPAVTPIQAMKILAAYVNVTHKLAFAESEVVKLGRLDRGQSTLNVAKVDDMDDETALEELSVAADIHDRLARERAGATSGEDPPVH